MTKKYKHQPRPPKVHLDLQRANKALSDLQRDHERLQTALRMLTSTDKQTLLDAVESLENQEKWWADPMTQTVSNSPMIATHTGTTLYTTVVKL